MMPSPLDLNQAFLAVRCGDLRKELEECKSLEDMQKRDSVAFLRKVSQELARFADAANDAMKKASL